MDQQITVKAFLQRPSTGLVEVRRFPLITAASGGFVTLQANVAAVFPGLKDLGGAIRLTWRDFDGDYVLMSSDDELQDALTEAKNNILNIYVSVEQQAEQAETEPFTVLNQQGKEAGEVETSMEVPETVTTNQETPKEPTSIGQQNTENDRASGAPPTITFIPLHPSQVPPPPMPPHPFGFPGQAPPPPPPPPSFPFSFPFAPGPMPGRGRRHCHGPMHGGRGPFPHPMMPGMPWSGENGHFEGPQPERRGCGFWSSFFEGEPPQAEGTGRGGFRALINKVPMKQRRWAKNYIKQWRQKNLGESPASASEGATASPNDACEAQKDPVISMEEAGVTNAYVDWLEEILPKILKKNETSDAANYDHLINEEISVSQDFQKWCLGFLKWNSGNSKRGCRSSFKCGPRGMWKMNGGCGNKEMSEELKAAVPRKYRLWAKSYITQWRIDHVINRHMMPSSSSGSSSESEIEEQSLPDVIDVPEDYRKWLEMFLTRWHTKNGVKVQETEGAATGGVEQFKDTVPMEFRKWVRCYVNRHKKRSRHFHGAHRHGHGPFGHHHHHGHHGPHGVDSHHARKKFMKKMHKRWMKNEWEGGFAIDSSSSSSDSSSDEEMQEKDMASSFKRMCLDPQASGQQMPGHPNPGFAAAMGNIPPQMHQFMMMKMMRKMQAKQEKMARKAAKKAAKRDVKEMKRAMKFSQQY